jgi:adenylate cyclase
MTIRFFSKSDTYRGFSNFAPFPIDVDGTRWPSTEHYYQAQKFDDPDLQERIRAVAILDQIVTEFDRLAAAHGVEKIKTIGDGYMAVAGVSRPQGHHLPRLARMALCLPDIVARLCETHGVDLRVRVGIADGPAMAGVIGADKFSYDVWGETVNLASRAEIHGLPGEIQLSGAGHDALCEGFVFEPRGPIGVKGVGRLETWLLKAERGSSAGTGATA